MICKVGFETERLFDLMLMHGEKADAVHETGPFAPQVQPEFIGPLMHICIHPPDIEHAEHIAIPENGGLTPDPFLKQPERFPHHVVGGNQGNVVVEELRP